MNKLEQNGEILSEEEIKKILNFLGGYKYIEPDLKSEKKLSFEEIQEKNKERKRKNIELFKQYTDVEFISNELGLELEPIYVMDYKTLKMDGFKTHDLEFSSDSSVFRIKGTNKILKIYYHLGKDVISKYHEIQNGLANEPYKIELDGELNGEKFNKIEFDVHKLSKENIYGNETSSISIIPEIQPGIQTENDFESDNLIGKDIVSFMIKEINKKNNLNIPENSLHSMNVSFQKIENGVLYATITDLGNHIKNFLQYFDKGEINEIKDEKEGIIKRILNILGLKS
ncbi:MAG: hypothetical protein WC850_02305 [Candidatus Gracilibacteria bacterium]